MLDTVSPARPDSESNAGVLMSRLGLLFKFAVVALAFGLPLAGLGLGSITSPGEPGALRITPFWWGLTLLDPFLQRCWAQSVGITTAALVMAVIVGPSLAALLERGARWQQRAGLGLCQATAACGPFLAAFGMITLAWRFDAPFGARTPAWLEPTALPSGASGLFLTQACIATAWVVLETTDALRRIPPDWDLWARQAGAKRRWVWKTACWPLLRPRLGRLCGILTVVLLLEPGAPWLLGVERTLAVQALVRAISPEPGSWGSASAIGLIGAVSAALTVALWRRWGGPVPPLPATVDVRARAERPEPTAGRRWLGLMAALMTGVFALPTFGALFGPVLEPIKLNALTQSNVPFIFHLLQSALIVGALTAVVWLGLAWAMERPHWAGPLRSAARFTPPLAIGLGLWAAWGLVEHRWLGLPRVEETDSGDLIASLRWLGPYRSPLVLLAWGTAVALLPSGSILGIGDERTAARRAALKDVFRVIPRARRRLPRTLGRAFFLPGLLKRFGYAVIFAATSLAPALVLTPLADFRPIGATVLKAVSTDPQALAAPWLLLTVALAAWLRFVTWSMVPLERTAEDEAELPRI